MRSMGRSARRPVGRLRRTRLARWFRDGRARLRSMAPTIVQCSVAAALAWLVARNLLGHPRPFFAPIAVLICIGVAAGQRLRRLVELVAGVGVGIGVGDLLISRIGSGSWQIALVVALAMAATVLLGKGSLMLTQAGSSAVLVATLLPPSGTGGLDRMVDALLGGLLGILAICVLPPDPLVLAHRSAAPVFDALVRTLLTTADAIRRRDGDHAAFALRMAREADGALGAFHQALETGREIVLISPWRRRARPLFGRYVTAGVPLDHAMRNGRVLARRTVAALRDDEPIPPAVPDGLEAVARAARLLQDELAGEGASGRARRAAIAAAETVNSVVAARPAFSTHVIAAQLRSISVDLLRATGAGDEAAVDAMPRLADPDEA